MSRLGDVIAGLKQVLLIEHRIDELTKRVVAIDERETNTRERLIRIEGMIEGARAAAAANGQRRLR